MYAGDNVDIAATVTISAAGSGGVLVRGGTNFNGGTPINGTNAGNLVMQDGSTIESEAGNITLQAPGDVALSAVNADADNINARGNVIVTADFVGVGSGLSDDMGAILDNLTGEGSGNANIIGGTVTLTAATGIGSGTGVLAESEDIDVDAVTLSAGNSTSGAIQIFEVNNVALGTITNLGRVVILDAGGAITDGNGADVVNISAGNTAIRAVSGIGDGVGGAAGDLDTMITGNLAVQTDTGDINIHNMGSLTVAAFGGLTLGSEILDTADDNSGNDHVTIRAASPAASPLTINSAVVNNDGGNITLAAEGATDMDDLGINANITATGGNGDIGLYAGDSVDIAATVTISAAGSGGVLVRGGTNFNGGTPINGTNAGNLVMQDGSTIESEAGNITLQAPGNVALSTVNADADNINARGNVIVTADFDGVGGGLSDNVGAILDNLTGEGSGNANIIGGTVTLTAATGIGSGTGVLAESEDIDVDAVTLSAGNSTSGAIQIFEVNNVALGTITNLARVVILDADGAITDGNGADVVNISAGNTAIRAVSGIGDGVGGAAGDLDTMITGNLAVQTDTGRHQHPQHGLVDGSRLWRFDPGQRDSGHGG